MHVKIETACNWDGKRREAGSVIDVPEDVQELNSSWMKKTKEELSDAPAPKEPTPAKGEK